MAQEHEETYEDRKKNWDLSGSLENIIHRYIHQITNAELKEINLEMQAGMLESEIKAGIKLPLVEMRQRRETFLLQKEKSFSEPVITILKSDTADLPAGSKLSLLDADGLLLRRNPGSVEYQIQFLLRGKEKVQNAVIDLSKLSGTGTFADSIVGDASFAPSSVDYLKKHRDLSILERAAKRVLRVNKKSDMRAYANALLSYVQEARNCLNFGQNLPKRPSRKDFTEKSTIKYSESEIVNTADSADATTPESKEVQPQEAYSHIIRHLHKLWFHIKSGLTAARSPNHYDILVSGILWFLWSAVHGQTFRLCQQNIILKDRINKRCYILFISPSGRTIFLSLAKLLSILSLEIYHCPHTDCSNSSRSQTFRLYTRQQLFKR